MSWRRACARAACLVLLAGPAAAQESAPVPLGQIRTAQGLVQHPGADGAPAPVRGARVVLHRVGTDHAGPLDSVLTDARGAFRFRYTTTGSPDAVYFASTTYDGIAYFTSPFQAQTVASPDGDIMVFDTATTGITLHLQGRHLVIGAPGANGVRDIAEVWDLGNDSTKTLVARDSATPLWTTQLPAGAQSPTVSGGDVAPAAVQFVGNELRLFAPVSPGVRQLAVSFGMPASAFPLSIPMGNGVGVLELLLEEASATPVMPGLAQQSSVSSQGRTFKRYLAQDVPAGAVLRVEAGGGGASGSRTRFIAGMVFAIAVVMAFVLVASLVKRRPGPPQPQA